jgi:hypothetical protein
MRARSASPLNLNDGTARSVRDRPSSLLARMLICASIAFADARVLSRGASCFQDYDFVSGAKALPR